MLSERRRLAPNIAIAAPPAGSLIDFPHLKHLTGLLCLMVLSPFCYLTHDGHLPCSFFHALAAAAATELTLAGPPPGGSI